MADARARDGSRPAIRISDGTLRDAHQCLWATRMRTEHMLPIAERLDSAGFSFIEAIAMVQFDVAVRSLNQNPFERIRLLRDRITRTPLRAAIRSNLMSGFYPVAPDINELFVERMFANGIRDFGFLESLHCWDNVAPAIQTARRLGATVSAGLIFNLAPGYDAAFYEAKAREVVERFDVQNIVFGCAAGIMSLEDVRTIVPAIKRAIGHRTLEFNTHCLTGLGPLLAIEAAVHGADCVFTAVDPLTNGNSVPSSHMIASNLRALGLSVDLDDTALDDVTPYLAALAEHEGQPVGVAAEYNPFLYKSQFAGGAISNLEAQLKQAGLGDKLPEVIQEIARVREELGSPVMATPFPAIVAAQAVMNVVNGERYRVVPDEVKKYICGYFGALPLPVDQNIADRIITNGSRDVALTPPPLEPVLPGLRQRYKGMDDDQMLLRYMFGDEKIDALVPTSQDSAFSVTHPIVDLVETLAKLPRKGRIHVSRGDWSLNCQLKGGRS
ncbi:carboxylase [Paraburkholderia sp. BL10I2N1]|uniref:carboxylase n=1 Tax=Paraburkholderia sp. BL10I2N1 TaxID=1938796 RepID=UPI00105D4147|nr:carboxylase [Paraburkholderia sp. BL10I2N1]